MDLTKMTDEQLDSLRRAVLREQERRANLAMIPDQIRDLAGKYREGGGDEDTLRDALTPEEQEALSSPA